MWFAISHRTQSTLSVLSRPRSVTQHYPSRTPDQDPRPGSEDPDEVERRDEQARYKRAENYRVQAQCESPICVSVVVVVVDSDGIGAQTAATIVASATRGRTRIVAGRELELGIVGLAHVVGAVAVIEEVVGGCVVPGVHRDGASRHTPAVP